MATSFYSKAVADLWFSAGSANPKGFGCNSIIWSNVSWKLHDNERNWTRGRVSLAPLESTNAKSARLWWRQSTCRTIHPSNQLLGTLNLMSFLDSHCAFWYYVFTPARFFCWNNAFCEEMPLVVFVYMNHDKEIPITWTLNSSPSYSRTRALQFRAFYVFFVLLALCRGVHTHFMMFVMLPWCDRNEMFLYVSDIKISRNIGQCSGNWSALELNIRRMLFFRVKCHDLIITRYKATTPSKLEYDFHVR